MTGSERYSQNLDVKKFDGSGYHDWVDDFTLAMRQRGWWKFFRPLREGESVPSVETASNEEKESASMAFCTLLQCLAKDMRKLVRNLDPDDINSPRAAWELLAASFSETSRMDKLLALHRFFSLRIKDGETMQSWVSKVKGARNELEGMGIAMEEDIVLSILLCTLPNEWSSIVENALAVGGISMDGVIARLLNEDKRRNVRDNMCNNGEDDSVLVSAAKGGKAKVKVKTTSSTALDAPKPHQQQTQQPPQQAASSSTPLDPAPYSPYRPPQHAPPTQGGPSQNAPQPAGHQGYGGYGDSGWYGGRGGFGGRGGYGGRGGGFGGYGGRFGFQPGGRPLYGPHGDKPPTGQPCHYCASPDHWWKSCPQRPYWWHPGMKGVPAEKVGCAVGEYYNWDGDGDGGDPMGKPDLVVISKEVGNRRGGGWLVDSGASRHVTNRRDLIINYRNLAEPATVMIGDSRRIFGYGCGDVVMRRNDGKEVMFTDVLFVPSMFVSVLSVSKLDLKGIGILFKNEKVKMERDGVEIAEGVMWRGVYRLVGEMKGPKMGGMGERLSSPPLQPLPSTYGIGG